MSAGPDPQVDQSQIEQARRQITRLAEEIAHLSEMELAPAEYYGEFLQRLLQALAAPAGAVWLRTPQGNLQLQYQINMRQVGLDRSDNGRQMHDELLRQAAMKGQPLHVPPQSGAGNGEAGKPAAAGNPTDHAILIAPILVDKQTAGLVEVWQDAKRGPDAQRGFLQFIVKMSALAAGYTRNHQLRTMVGQQAVWTQLESFAKQIHGTLNPTEVAYLVANESRRLLECDRVSVGVRQGGRVQVLAISGADVVEKRSNLVQLMRKLFETVQTWGEKLVYSGTKDDTLPPAVNKALDAYLAESNSKLLVVLPQKDDREEKSKRPPRSALMMECFEPAAAPEQMVARLDVIARHATTALYNAVEHRRIPMRFLWLPLAKLQDGLGGKARAILTLVGVAFVLFVAAMVFVPYPLRMEAKGQLLPIKRGQVFATRPGIIKEIMANVQPGKRVAKDQQLFRLFDEQLAREVIGIKTKILIAENTIKGASKDPKDPDRPNTSPDVVQATIELNSLLEQRELLFKRNNAILEEPGHFWVKAPISGIVLTSDFKENLLGRPVKPDQPLLRIGQADMEKKKLSEWEIELRIPQTNIGQVLNAFKRFNDQDLDVDLLVRSEPTASYRGKLPRSQVAFEAVPNRNEQNESEPVVIARVKIDSKDIPPEARIPTSQLLSGIEVSTRIRCGNHAMGYSLFYGVWEFIYEKIIFFF